MTRVSKVALFERAGEPLRITGLEIPRLVAGETLVRVTCCTICGSDLHTFQGNRRAPTPSILGHEIIGIVEEVSGHGRAKKGERVTWSVAASCGGCSRCRSDLPQKCDSLFKYGHEPVKQDQSSSLSGGLAEYCILQPGTAITVLPSHLPDELLAPASCATATVAAAFRTAGDVKGKRVLILGAGMLGLTTSAFASVLGASQICVCEVQETRRNRALTFGATDVCQSADAAEFDCVFEMSGNAAAVETAVRAADIGGRVVLVGSVSPSKSIPIDPERIVRRLISIHGVHNYRPADLETAVRLLTSHHETFPFASLVEATYSLGDANQAFDFAMKQRPVRVAVKP